MADVLAITDGNIEEEALNSDIPAMVVFHATWCSHSRRIMGLVQDVADAYDGRLKVGKLDVFAEDEAPRKYRILSTPTVIVFRGGEEVIRLVGSSVRENLKNRLEELLSA